ncbi:MAG: hypothetical protein H7339_09390 [Arcicella sp.]|nr:hypothetical protein [Arcicella sp.]
MGIIRGVIASANKRNRAVNYKLSLFYTSNSNLIVETDSLTDMMTYLASFPFNQPATLQFNTSDTFTVTSNLAFNFSNGGRLFTVKAKTGQNPVIDANNVLPTVMNISMSNFVLDGVKLINADLTDSAGAIIRVNSNTRNITIKNTKFKRGYCAMRATGIIDGNGNVSTYIDGLTITDCSVEDTINGSFRLGNGDAYGLPASSNFSLRTSGYYDMRNVTIQNIKLIDNFNKGVITGQASGFMGMMILKRTLNLTVKNIVCNNTSESILQLETSANVNVNKIVCDNFGCRGLNNQQGIYVSDVDGFTITNTLMKANADGVGKLVAGLLNVRGFNAYHNTFAYINNGDVPFFADKMALVRLVGNIFKSSGSSNPCTMSFSTDNGYVPSLVQDLLEENYNVFCSDGSYNVNLKLYSSPASGVVDTEVQINSTGSKITPATYRSNYNIGANSVFTTDTSVLFSSRTNPNSSTSYAMYVDEGKQGRNLIPSIQKLVDVDAFGFVRTFPTDAGATDRDAIVLG